MLFITRGDLTTCGNLSRAPGDGEPMSGSTEALMSSSVGGESEFFLLLKPLNLGIYSDVLLLNIVAVQCSRSNGKVASSRRSEKRVGAELRTEKLANVWSVPNFRAGVVVNIR